MYCSISFPLLFMLFCGNLDYFLDSVLSSLGFNIICAKVYTNVEDFMNLVDVSQHTVHVSSSCTAESFTKFKKTPRITTNNAVNETAAFHQQLIN